jgi:hypothetical protein
MCKRRPSITRIDARPTRMQRLPDDPGQSTAETFARRRSDYVVTLLTEGHALDEARRLAAGREPPVYTPPQEPWSHKRLAQAEEEWFVDCVAQAQPEHFERVQQQHTDVRERRRANMVRAIALGKPAREAVRTEAMVRTLMFETISRQRALHRAGADVFRDADLFGLDLDFVPPLHSRG